MVLRSPSTNRPEALHRPGNAPFRVQESAEISMGKSGAVHAYEGVLRPTRSSDRVHRHAQVPVEDRTKFLSIWFGYPARAFEEYLRMLAIGTFIARDHPQTNGKIERFHETLRARIESAGLPPARTNCVATWPDLSIITTIALPRPSAT